MKRLCGFDESFINIVLSLAVSVLITIVLAPFIPELRDFISGNFGRDSERPFESYEIWLAIGLGFFIVKYLHESSVFSHRFQFTTGQYRTPAPLNVLLYVSRIAIPVMIFLILGWFLVKPHTGKERMATLLFGAGLFALHTFFYAIKDIYLVWTRPMLKEGAPTGWDPSWTVCSWVITDVLVVLAAIGLMAGGGWIIWLDWDVMPTIARYLSLIMIGQSLLDYLINWKFFFRDSDHVPPQQTRTRKHG